MNVNDALDYLKKSESNRITNSQDGNLYRYFLNTVFEMNSDKMWSMSEERFLIDYQKETFKAS